VGPNAHHAHDDHQKDAIIEEEILDRDGAGNQAGNPTFLED